MSSLHDTTCLKSAKALSLPAVVDVPVPTQDTPSLEDLKLMYYKLLIRYHEHHNSYIDICRCYRSIYEVGFSCHFISCGHSMHCHTMCLQFEIRASRR